MSDDRDRSEGEARPNLDSISAAKRSASKTPLLKRAKILDLLNTLVWELPKWQSACGVIILPSLVRQSTLDPFNH